MCGGVGEEADFVDAEVSEDLAAESDLAEDALVLAVFFTGALFFQGGGFAMEEDAVGLDAAVDIETTAGVVEVDEGPASGVGDLPQRLADEALAVAGGSSEDVSGEAVGVDADEDRVALGRDFSHDQGDMAFAAIDFAFVGDGAEFSVGSGEQTFSNAEDVALVLETVADELGDGEHFEAVFAAEAGEVGHAGHGSVVVHDFADDSGGDEARHASEVDGGFGLAGANEDSAAAGAKREDMAGAGEVVRGGARINGDLDGAGAVVGGDSGGDTFARFDSFSKCGAEAGGVLVGHGAEAEVVSALLGEGKADEASSVTGHEVDGLGSDELGGKSEVAFILAVLVVDNDDHAAGADFFQGSGNIGEGGGLHASIVRQIRGGGESFTPFAVEP